MCILFGFISVSELLGFFASFHELGLFLSLITVVSGIRRRLIINLNESASESGNSRGLPYDSLFWLAAAFIYDIYDQSKY